MSHDPAAAPSSLYLGRTISLLTKHEKQRVIAPVLETSLSCEVNTVSAFDTDQLGTFTREIAREGTQLEVARKKARIGMRIAGLPLGLGSEGSFGPDPMLGLIPWNVEFVLFLDDELGLEIVGVAQGKSNFAALLISHPDELQDFKDRVGFPTHQLIVRPDSEDDTRILKGISTESELAEALQWAFSLSLAGRVHVETDLRAHTNPTRMAVIKSAAEDLATKLATPCPACSTPGYTVTTRSGGLRCADCGGPTDEPCQEIHTCAKCAFTETIDLSKGKMADPGKCKRCNP